MVYSKYKGFRSVFTEIQKHINPEDEVIDFGCGLMPLTRNIECKKMIGIDAWYPYIKQLRDELVDQGDIFIWHLDLSGPLLEAANDNSVDVTLAIDFIEHLEKEDALTFIKHMERIARRRVIVYTTHGFILQEREENAEFQRHRCGFDPSEFEEMGYNISIRIGGDHKGFLAIKEL